MLDTLAASYWSRKIQIISALIFVPLMLAGWVGVFIGRRWGRTLLYVYLAVWVCSNILALLAYEEGKELMMWLSITAGMAGFLLWHLNMKSWKAWIEQQPLLPSANAPNHVAAH